MIEFYYTFIYDYMYFITIVFILYEFNNKKNIDCEDIIIIACQ